MVNVAKFAMFKPALEKGIEKIEKWYKATSQTDIAFACLGMCFLRYINIFSHCPLALDPRIKTEYAKQSWDAPRFDKAMAKFEKSVCGSPTYNPL
jgi:hypothetical protein